MKGGVFERFRDLEFFKRFTIESQPGVLTWGDEIDIAPETLYAEATNSPLPEWMVRDAPATTETGQPSGEGSEWVMEPKCQEKVGKREVSRFPPLSRIECPNPSRPGRQTGYSPPGEASAVRNVPFFL
jgi:hypothetical protein